MSHREAEHASSQGSLKHWGRRVRKHVSGFLSAPCCLPDNSTFGSVICFKWTIKHRKTKQACCNRRQNHAICPLRPCVSTYVFMCVFPSVTRLTGRLQETKSSACFSSPVELKFSEQNAGTSLVYWFNWWLQILDKVFLTRPHPQPNLRLYRIIMVNNRSTTHFQQQPVCLSCHCIVTKTSCMSMVSCRTWAKIKTQQDPFL